MGGENALRATLHSLLLGRSAKACPRLRLTFPQLLSRQTCTLGHRLELGPDKLRMEPTIWPAVSPCDDILPPHQVGVQHQVVRSWLRGLFQVCGPRYNTWRDIEEIRGDAGGWARVKRDSIFLDSRCLRSMDHRRTCAMAVRSTSWAHVERVVPSSLTT